MSKNQFNQEWCNQTELGKKFGISSIAIGKLLTEHGLRDLTTKSATSNAIDEGYAKFTPLKDNTPFYMWNIKKCKNIISKQHEELSQVDYHVNEIKKIIKEAERLCDIGQDKLGYMMYDCMYDEVPKQFRAEVKARIEAEEDVSQ